MAILVVGLLLLIGIPFMVEARNVLPPPKGPTMRTAWPSPRPLEISEAFEVVTPMLELQLKSSGKCSSATLFDGVNRASALGQGKVRANVRNWGYSVEKLALI